MGLTIFSTLCAVYVLAAGYWGVVMADFQQGIIAFIAIAFVSIWGVHAAGGESFDQPWAGSPVLSDIVKDLDRDGHLPARCPLE